MSAKQQAILLLSVGKTQTETSEAVGVDQATISRWLGESEFNGAVARESAEIWRKSVMGLGEAFKLAVDESIRILRDDKVSEAQKIRVIKTVFSSAPKWYEIANLEPRMKAIEEAMEWQV